MEKVAPSPEKYRLDICLAAIEVADVGDRHFPVGEVVPFERRQYLFAVPDPQPGEKPSAYRVSDLTRKLEISQAPIGVDYDRRSSRYGLRYIPDSVPVPSEVSRWTSREAQAGWEAWREGQLEINRAVADVARTLAKNPGANLDAERAAMEFPAGRDGNRSRKNEAR